MIREFVSPDITTSSVHNVTPETMEEYGCKVLSLDVDGTIMSHHGAEIPEDILECLKAIDREGYQIILTSNAYGERVLELEQIAQTVSRGVQVITPAAVRTEEGREKRYRKPHPAMIHEIADRLGVDVEDIMHVGDQLFKDVIAANRAGAKSVLVARYGKGGDPRVEYLQRPVEKIVVALFGIGSLRKQRVIKRIDRNKSCKESTEGL